MAQFIEMGKKIIIHKIATDTAESYLYLNYYVIYNVQVCFAQRKIQHECAMHHGVYPVLPVTE
jgi:hypothetical protein